MKKYYAVIPNILTLLRIFSAPVIFFLVLYHNMNDSHGNILWVAILLIMGFAVLTDFADGYFSRKWKIESHFGAMLDPIADKVLVIVLLFVATISGFLTITGHVAAMLIIVREVLLSGVREYTGRYGIVLKSSRLAKFKTLLQMTALFTIFIEHHIAVLRFVKFGEYLLFCAAIVTLITGIQYFRNALRDMRDIR